MLATLAAVALAAASPEDAVRAADVALDRAVAAGDAAAFAALLEDDATFASRRISRGREAVVEAFRPFLSPGGPRLRWAPVRAAVAASGDLAFTTGRWTLEAQGKDGEASRAEGEYVTVWRRAPGRGWRVLLDASLEPAARLGDGLAREPTLTATSAAGDLETAIGTWTRGAERGGWLLVRRRAPGGGWSVAVDSAFPFPPAQ